MPPSHTKRSQTAVTIPRDVYDTVVAFIQGDTRHGYVSAAEFVKDAIRRRLEELQLQRRAGDVGRRLDELRPDTDRAAAKIRAAAPNAKARFCHKCGEQLPLGALFCPACGTRSG